MKPPVNAEPNHLSRSIILGTQKFVRLVSRCTSSRSARSAAARLEHLRQTTQRRLRLRLAFGDVTLGNPKGYGYEY
jgi:hypothetical protein